MSGVQIIDVEPGEDGLRVDRWFKGRFPGLGHGRLEKLLRTGQVRVDGGVNAGRAGADGPCSSIAGRFMGCPVPAKTPELCATGRSLSARPGPAPR